MEKALKRDIVLLLIFTMLPLPSAWAQESGVLLKNNLLYDATLTPNLGVEVAVDSVWSVGAEVGLRIWPRDKWATRKYRHLLIAPEVRRWLKHTGTGHFVGANILYTHFNVVGVKFPFGLYGSQRHERKQGNAFALGPQYGYVWRLAPRWKLEAECGIDVGYQWSKVFRRERPCERMGSDHGFFLMPRLGVNIVYRIGRRQPSE